MTSHKPDPDKKTQADALPSHEFLRVIIDGVLDPIFVKDRQHRWIEGNKAFWDLLGGEAKAKGKSDYDFFPKELADQFWAGDERVFAGETFDEEEKLLTAEGKERTIATKKIAFTMANGEQALVGVIRDVTEQRQIEAEIVKHRDRLAELVLEKTGDIERQRRLYETILSGTPDFVYTFDLNYRFTYVNQALLTMWGKTWNEAIGKTCLELGYEPWHAKMHNNEIDTVVRTKLPIRGEVPFNGTHGRRIYDYIFVPVIGKSGEVEAVAGTTRDVTREREAMDALKMSSQKKDEFLATLAHELRNPLAPVRNALFLLKSDILSPERRQKAHGVVERQVEQMVRLVDDLMDVARINTGKIELRKEPVLLDDVLNHAVEIAQPLIDGYGHKLEINLPEQPIYLDGDMLRLSQIFANLLNNAAKYTERSGKIAIDASVEGGRATVTVTDNGIGISKDVQPLIFDMFSQADSSIEKSHGGLGIGLTITKKLVDLHQGSIAVKSGGVGQGSSFTVTLPVTDAKAAAPEKAIIVNDKATPLKVLIVDDNQASAQTLGWAVELINCEPAICNDGAQAIEIAKTLKPHVVLLDIGMPGTNGYEICRAMKALPELKNTVFIAQTGWGQQEHRIKSQEAGFQHHLVKPVDLNVLGEILRKIA